MGTSSSFGGPGNGTPLVPSWLEEGGPGEGDSAQDGNGIRSEQGVPSLPEIPPPGEPHRYTAARNNFSRFARSGGRNSATLGRAISSYVRTATGGSRTAAIRMGASRKVGGLLLGFLSDTVARGATKALRQLNLKDLAGCPIEQVFIGLADYVCPEGGTVDEGIARAAFIETITDLATIGVTDLESLTGEQMQTVMELYCTNAIEARLCNDIGLKIITLPANAHEVCKIQEQIHQFILGAVADALSRERGETEALTPSQASTCIKQVFEQAFTILREIGDAEVEAA